jgi:hypothetical protein
MDEARQKLEQAKRDGALEDQEEAKRELERAVAELEAILKQLREEEMKRTLADLEVRFRKMLEIQLEVYEGTRRLDQIAPSDRDRNAEIEAGRLSRRETVIATDLQKAAAVLREEGSSTALPEAVDQLSEDVDQIVEWLAKSDTGELTQAVEEDVIAGIEEIIEALRKAQDDLEKGKQPPPPQDGESGDQPLVDMIAELKMLRSLQMRINSRTKKYAKLVDGDLGQATTAELLVQLEELAGRQERVFQATRDIVSGKNK